MKKILFIAGTRPEAIKIAPVYLAMKRRHKFDPILCATGQHSDLMRHGLEPFGITPEISLDTMRSGQPLHRLLGMLFQQIGDVMAQVQPDVVIVQGDTVSAFAGGWCAFYEKISVTHIEAGLRTGNLHHPFPEEATRRALTIVSHIHMAPTDAARQNLLKEGVPARNVVVTGNTAIDALYMTLEKRSSLAADGSTSHPYPKPYGSASHGYPNTARRQILVTGHRRENLGTGLQNLCEALLHLAKNFSDVDIIFSVHPNPAVDGPVRELLGSTANIRLVPPQDYQQFVDLMADCYLIISDSGGVQEEAPALGKPVLVTRTTTERPEAIERGANRLIGCETNAIIEAATELLTDAGVYQKMSAAGCPYGDGKASQRICDYLEGLPVSDFIG